jgi:hypothetical protein
MGAFVWYFIAITLITLIETGDITRGVRLAAICEKAGEVMGVRSEPRLLRDYSSAMARARATLGDTAFAAAWESGRALTFEQAIAEALGEREPTT